MFGLLMLFTTPKKQVFYLILIKTKEYKNFSNTQFVGIDLSKKLIIEAKKRYKNIKNLNFYSSNASQ